MLIDNLQSGWKLGIFSYQFVFKNTKLLVFPLLTALCVASVCWIAWIFFLKPHLGPGGYEIYSATEGYSGLRYLLFLGIICYFLATFFAVFFNVATVITVNNYLTQQPVSIIGAILFSCSKLIAILMWTLIAATVGVIFIFLENIEKLIKSRILTGLIKMLTGMLEILWSIITYFVVPVICFKPMTNPFLLIKESIHTIKEIWNREGQFIRIVGANSVTFILFLIYFSINFMANKIVAWMNGVHTGNTLITFSTSPIGLINLSIFIILITLHLLTSATLKTIFYRYLTEGFVPKDLAKGLLDDAIIKK